MLTDADLDLIDEIGERSAEDENAPYMIIRSGNGIEIMMNDGRVGYFEPVMRLADEVHAHLAECGCTVTHNGSPDSLFDRDGTQYRVVASEISDSIVVSDGANPYRKIMFSDSHSGRLIAAFKRAIGPWLAGQ